MIDIRGLSYFVSQIENLSQWQRYAEDVLGMQVQPAPGGGLYVKMDERPFRMLIVEGSEARYLASGWELASESAFRAAMDHLNANGIEHQPGTAAEVEHNASGRMSLDCGCRIIVQSIVVSLIGNQQN